MPRYPVPVFLLGQLGVATSRHGQGFGSVALAIALGLFATMYRQLPAHAVVVVVVDCLDRGAERFYHHQGFQALDGVGSGSEGRERMFLPMLDVLELFGSSDR